MNSALQPTSQNPEIQLRKKIAELEQRLFLLERLSNRLLVEGANPTAGTGTEGQTFLTSVGGTYRFWAYINGAWRYVNLT